MHRFFGLVLLALMYVVAKYRYILPHREDWAAMKSELSNLFATGLSMGLMGCIVNIGTVISASLLLITFLISRPISWVFMTIMLAAMYFYYMPRDEKLYSKENSKEN